MRQIEYNFLPPTLPSLKFSGPLSYLQITNTELFCPYSDYKIRIFYKGVYDQAATIPHYSDTYLYYT